MAGLLDLLGLGNMNQPGGLLTGINQGIRGGMESPMTQLGLGLLSGNGWQEGIRNAVGMYGSSEKQRREEEAYKQLIAAMAPQMGMGESQGAPMPPQQMMAPPAGPRMGGAPPQGAMAAMAAGGPAGGLFGGGGVNPTTGGATAALSPPGAPTMSDAPPVGGPRPGGAVPSSPKVWGDREAEAAGLYEKMPGAAPPATFNDRFASAYGNAPMPPQAPQTQPQQMAQPQPPQQRPPMPLPPTNPASQNINRLLLLMLNPNLKEGPRKALELMVNKALDDAKLPEEQKNYVQYYKQATAAGQPPMPFFDYQIRLKQAGATAITNDMRGENAEAKVLGEGAGGRANATMTAASAASKQLVDINRTSALLKNIEQGKIQPARMTVSAWAKSLGLPDDAAVSLGLDPKAVGDAQALQALVSKSVVAMIGQGGFPANNFSDADREFLLSTVPQLGNDPRANAIIIEAARRSAQRDIEKAKEWMNFRRENKGKSYDDFEILWSDKVARQDLFGDLRRDAEGMVGAPQQGRPSGAPTGTPSRQDIENEMRRRGLLR